MLLTLSHRITAANRDYHHLSQSEIGGEKRIYQHLSGSVTLEAQLLTVIAPSRTRLWLPSGWGCRGRRPSTVRENPCRRRAPERRRHPRPLPAISQAPGGGRFNKCRGRKNASTNLSPPNTRRSSVNPKKGTSTTNSATPLETTVPSRIRQRRRRCCPERICHETC